MQAVVNSNFKRGDKVLYHSSDEQMVGNVMRVKGVDTCIVKFYVPGRKRNGYYIEVDIPANELTPCYTMVS